MYQDIFIPGPTIDTIIMARETSRIRKRTGILMILS